MKKLLIATHNKGKVVELADLLQGRGFRCLNLDQAGVAEDVEETGRTLAENAILKATTYARMTGLLTLADDSGLEVDALDGAPGVYTARFGGPGLTPVERYELLLEKLDGLPEAGRGARFRCVVALANPAGLLHTSEGICPGRIATAPAGSGGFGYDPVFYLPEHGQTMAQLPREVKQQIGHRGRAVRGMVDFLKRATDNR